MATRKLVVEIIDAQQLLPKDGTGTSSPYVVADFDGQRKKTRTVHRDLNPKWNEVLEFHVSRPKNMAGEVLEIDVYHDKHVGPTRRNNFLGRLRLDSGQFVRQGEEALIYYPLERKSLLNWVQGEIGLKIYYLDEPIPAPVEEQPPPPPPAEEQQPPPPASAEEQPAPAPAPAAEAEAPPPPEPPLPESAPENPPEPQSPPETNPAPENPPPPAPETTTEQPTANASADPPLEPIPGENAPANYGRESNTSAIPMQYGPHLRQRIFTPATPDVYPREIATSHTDRGQRERSSFDLVDKMEFLFVRVVKARCLSDPQPAAPFVKIEVSGRTARCGPARKMATCEWEETFAFGREIAASASTLEVSVWDSPESSNSEGSAPEVFLGGVCFDLLEIPTRVLPDSPLAPQWYRLEGGESPTGVSGDVMLAVWFGTQADESFPGAWYSDTAVGASCRSKVYISPKLWYLRTTVIEAQDLPHGTGICVRAQLGFQILKTRKSTTRNGSLSWNEDLVLVAAEPFEEQLALTVESFAGKDTSVLGQVLVPLTGIERRVDNRLVASRWLDVGESGQAGTYQGRLHVRLCFDGGYHVMDEWTHLSSDFRPTAKQLWRPAIGKLELGILGGRNLLPMKTKNGKGSTDAYCVAKYGEKWVRTRTMTDSLDPVWNEQYTWQVYDPCTTLTVSMFDNWQIYADVAEPEKRVKPECRIGKVRIRVSALESGKVYKNSYPLMLLLPPGLKRMGELDLAVRFSRVSELEVLHAYMQPLLPPMHYIRPMGITQQEALRNVAARIVAQRLARAEPPLRREAVLYMLEADAHAWSIRRTRANWYRIVNVLSPAVEVLRWTDDVRRWRNPATSMLVHFLAVLLVCFPELIVPTLFCYVFFLGTWNYKYKPRSPPQIDAKLSLADVAEGDDLDEEFDPIPSVRPPEVVRARYDRLRLLAARVQTVLGDLAAQGERVQALVCWRDPRATGIFLGMCFLAAAVLYLVPLKVVAIIFVFYCLRHPMFRDPMPAPVLSFLRRLPSLSERVV
ncbi:QUIRKY protein [Nymphaea thermarum]|nr:QUIRKY protein [Nymphaea thermarum]